MKIIIVCPGYSTGNRELQPLKYFERLSSEFIRLGHSVRIGSSSKEDIKNNPEEVKIISLGPFNFGMRQILRDSQCLKVGIITYPLYEWYELVSANLKDVIINLKHTYTHILYTILPKRTKRNFLNSFDILIAESERNAVRLRDLGIKSRIEIVRPGVDEEFLQPIKRGSDSEKMTEHLIVYAGSAMPLRGAKDLVIALKNLKNCNWKLILLLRPDCGTEKDIQEILRISRDDKRIVVSQKNLSIREMANQYRSSEVAVFPFRFICSEMPVAPLEAISCGSKVVVPSLDGLADLESYGAFCYSHGDVSSLSKSIETSLQNEADISPKFNVKGWNVAANRIIEIIESETKRGM